MHSYYEFVYLSINSRLQRRMYVSDKTKIVTGLINNPSGLFVCFLIRRLYTQFHPVVLDHIIRYVTPLQ